MTETEEPEVRTLEDVPVAELALALQVLDEIPLKGGAVKQLLGRFQERIQQALQ